MLAGSHSELFTGISIVHPAMLDVKDVKGLAVPLAMYPSKVRCSHPLPRSTRVSLIFRFRAIG